MEGIEVKTKNRRLKTSRGGWIVWVWSKAGTLIFFMGMMLMMMSAYSFVSASGQSGAANQVAQSLRNSITDTYNSAGGMSFEHELPPDLNGQAYSLEALDKGGDMVGIIVRVKSGVWEVSGGSSVAIPLSKGSFGVLKSFDSELHYICIVKDDGMIYLERSRC